jgi:hypothetical protein
MAPPLTSEPTSFTLDNMGRFLCNTLQEALDSSAQTIGGRRRDFDVLIVGGGTFGAVVAEHLFIADATETKRSPSCRMPTARFRFRWAQKPSGSRLSRRSRIDATTSGQHTMTPGRRAWETTSRTL